MNVLGLSNVENASAAIVVGGEVVAAAEEERFVRVKHYRGFPRHAIDYCLAAAGAEMDDIDVVTTGWVPYRGWVRRGLGTLRGALDSRSLGTKVGRGSEYTRMIGEQLRLRKILGDDFGLRRRPPIRHTNHHLAHMASAFYMSPFDEAALLTLDGTGEYQTVVMAEYRDGGFHVLADARYPYSLGHLYSVGVEFLRKLA